MRQERHLSTHLDNHRHVFIFTVSGCRWYPQYRVPQWTGVATHGPVTGGSSASRQPTSGRGHRAMGGSWTRAGHGWKMMLHNIRRRSLLTSALKAKFTIHDVKIAKYSCWMGGHSWTHAELQLDTFYLILMRMHVRPLAFRHSEI